MILTMNTFIFDICKRKMSVQVNRVVNGVNLS